MVGEAPPLQDDRLGGDDFGHHRVFQTGGSQPGHVQGGGVVVLIPQAVGVGEMGPRHPQIPGPLVHPAHKGLHVPGAVGGQGHRRVVARVEEEAVEQGLQGDLLPRLEVERGPLDARPLLLDGDGLGQVIQVFRRHQGGHQLGDAGDGPLLVLILGIEDAAGVRVQQNSGGRGNRRRLRRHGMDQQPRPEDAERRQSDQFSSHKVSLHTNKGYR